MTETDALALTSESQDVGISVHDRVGGITWSLWGAVVAGVCLLAALTATWPLAANLSTTVPLGTEHEATVQVFGIWTLWWTFDRATHGFAGYWDAPFFHPNAGVFTYSEPEPLTGLLVAPLWPLGASPAFIHNAALLLLLTLNGLFAYRLGRALDAPRLPALLGGVLIITLPFIAKVEGVLNLVPVFGILWSLDGLVRFGKSGSLRHAFWAAAGLVAAYLTCQQYMLMFAPFAVAAGIVALAQQRFQTKAIIRLLSASLVAGLIILVVALPAIILHDEIGLSRSDAVVQQLSARLGDFLTRPGIAWLNFPPRSWDDTGGLFPGLAVLLLAIAGAIVGFRQAGLRRWAIFFAVSALAAAILAMGANHDLAIWQPYEVLRALVPGFSELRSPFRFALLMQLSLAVLATLAFVQISRYSVRAGSLLVILAALIATSENLALPMPLTQVPLSPRQPWTEWVRSQPVGTVVAHVPFAPGLHVSDYEIDAWRMFAQIDHQKPIINGYSSYFPPGYTQFQIAMSEQFPQQGLLCALNKGLQANTLVVDKGWLSTHNVPMDSFKTFLTPVYNDNLVQIYHLQMPNGACEQQTTAP